MKGSCSSKIKKIAQANNRAHTNNEIATTWGY
ncbi:hypothetical protein NK6_7020 [Bradyrhizobium diazoefficiens]|uniref:Uncharacterized protein n=1 Tax=Bradyrhizobium diazoefficiens TaxID=1355477 RepID=A0A0E4BT87_9BRAD|nr:hypothetical protein NK6_7020 [Bradyrhizobium diazoefficiens]